MSRYSILMLGIVTFIFKRNAKGHSVMKSMLLEGNGTKDPEKTLASFLSTIPALLKYGRTVIYPDDIWYIPYRRKIFRVQETGEMYQFLCSFVSENIVVTPVLSSSKKENIGFKFEEKDLPEKRTIKKERNIEQVDEEIKNQMKLDRTISKIVRKYHLIEEMADEIYIQEKAFCVRGREDTILLVDMIAGKVDFGNLEAVQRVIAKEYLSEHN